MYYKEKITQLRNTIRQELSSLIKDKECILLEAPYHNNIGDLCIWQGEIEFLNSIGAKLLFTKSLYWTPTDNINPQTVILLSGGGNFGDIYRSSQSCRLEIIAKYPHNRIVMFPQSVWYDDKGLIAQDAAIMSQHKDLWLCARDKTTYEFFKKHFPSNHVLLVPDMAFYLSDSQLNHYRNKENSGRRLFMRRTDGELVKTTPGTLEVADVRDWPGFADTDLKYYFFHQAKRGIRVLSSIWLPIGRQWERIIDKIADKSLRPRLVNSGLELISNYDQITTTRLHALILSVLLGKNVEYIDNKTGKLSDYVDTWLSDLNSVRKASL